MKHYGMTVAWLKKAQEIARLGNWDQDVASGELWWSDEVYRIFGLEPQKERMNFFKFLDLVHPDYRQLVIDKTDLALDCSGSSYKVDYVIVRPDNITRHVHEEALVYRDHNGDPIRMVGIIQDITERKEAELEIKKFRAAVEYASDCIVMIDQEGYVTYANKSSLTVLGYADRDLLGKNITEFLQDNRLIKQIAVQLNRNENWAGEIVIRLKGGVYFPVHLSLSVVKDDHGNPIGNMGVFRDITKEKAEREELERAKRAAETATRIKGQFLANMSHEIRTPMNAIVGFNRLLLNEMQSPKQRKFAKYIQEAAESLLGLINDILDFSKVESGTLELEERCFDLDELVQSVTRTLSLKAVEKRVRLFWNRGSSVPVRVVGDELRLRQILLNLVGNAIKFTENGKVEVSAKLEKKDGDSLQLCFKVADTGIGIPFEAQGKIFDSFTQVDSSTTRSYGGSGLGLSICKKLVGLLGGRVWLRSALGEGSVFYFTCQLKQGMDRIIPEKFSEQQSSATCANVSGLNILVADDNLFNQELAREILRQDGHNVALAQNGLEVLTKLCDNSYDLIFMDIQMPEMDGITATRVIRRAEKECHPKVMENQYVVDKMSDNIHGSYTPVVAMTAHVMERDRQKCIKAGMDDFIGKPFKPDEIYKVLENVVVDVSENRKFA